MNESVVKIMDLDPTQFKFKPTKKRSKFRELYVNMNPLVVKFPKLRIPFDSKINQYGQSEITLSLAETYTKTFTSQDLIKKIDSIDKYIEEFGKSENFLEDFPETIRYNPILKRSLNGNYPPTLKAKLSKRNGDIESIFCDEQMKEISFNSEEELLQKLTKGTLLNTSINFAGLYFNDNTWGMTCKFHQSKISTPKFVQKEQKEQKNIDFLESSDDEDEEENGE